MSMRGPETFVERQVAQILKDTGFANGVGKPANNLEDLSHPPTHVDKLHSDLEDNLMIAGGLLGVVGGGIVANMMVNTEGVSWFLAIGSRMAVTSVGITVGAFVGTGYCWLAAKTINLVRSRFG